MAYFVKGVNSSLAKPPLKFNGSLTNLGQHKHPFVKWDTGKKDAVFNYTVSEYICMISDKNSSAENTLMV